MVWSYLIVFVLGIITTLVGQFLWRKIEPRITSEEVIEIYGKVKAYRTRERVAESLQKITGNTRAGDTLFGHCRTCGRYPNKFFEELEEAKKRGVNVMALITLTNKSEDFAKRLLEIGGDAEKYGCTWEVRGLESEEIKIRVFGYRSKDGKRGEILISFPFIDAYVGLHFKDPRVVEYFWPSFEEKWNSR